MDFKATNALAVESDRGKMNIFHLFLKFKKKIYRCWKKGKKEDKEEEMSTVEPIETESKEKPDGGKQNKTLKDSPELTRIFIPLQGSLTIKLRKTEELSLQSL